MRKVQINQEELFNNNISDIEVCEYCGTLSVKFIEQLGCYLPRNCKCKTLRHIRDKYDKEIIPINEKIAKASEEGVSHDHLIEKRNLIKAQSTEEANRWIKYYSRDNEIIKQRNEESINDEVNR